MLQHQQELLQKMFEQQEEMKFQQKVLSQKLTKLEEEFHSSSCSSSPAAFRKTKNRVTRDLTVSKTYSNCTIYNYIDELINSLCRTRLPLFTTALKKDFS